MRPPSRKINSIRPLPSIYTTFPVNYDIAQSSIDSEVNSGTCMIRQIEDGIEVVPFERCHNLSAPILSPDQGEKEVLVISQQELRTLQKSLPPLPTSLWRRLSVRQRVLALLCIQFLMLMTIGLALLGAKRRAPNDETSQVRATVEETPEGSNTTNIRRGIYTLPIQLPQQQSSECLNKLNESMAWQCASDTAFRLSILPSPANNTSSTMITMGSASTNTTLLHGHQVPVVHPTELLSLSTPDTYYFRTTYDRIVLLKKDDFTPPNDLSSQPAMRHPPLKPGETLWRCIFNETVIEGYITLSHQPASASDETTANTSDSKLPYGVKLVEQRMPNGKTPYCEKTTMRRDGSLSAGSERVMLNLSEPEAESNAKEGLVRRRVWKEGWRRDENKRCSCQWMVE